MADFAAPTIPLKLRAPGEFEWATYINDRHPQFKIHRTAGHAHSALTNRLSYGSRNPRRVTADIALYHLEGGEWVPQLQLPRGAMITHFPWQEAPPSPEELRREREVSSMTNALESVIYTAQRELQGEVQGKVLAELKIVRAKVLQLVQEFKRVD